MGGLSPECLELTRRTLEGRMLDEATVLTNSGTGSGDLGGRSGTWVPGETYNCRAIGSRETEGSEGGRVTAIVVTDFTFPWNTPITAGNRLVYNGHTYEITGTNEDQTERTSLLVTTRRR